MKAILVFQRGCDEFSSKYCSMKLENILMLDSNVTDASECQVRFFFLSWTQTGFEPHQFFYRIVFQTAFRGYQNDIYKITINNKAYVKALKASHTIS